jgi:hypothetical protein
MRLPQATYCNPLTAIFQRFMRYRIASASTLFEYRTPRWGRHGRAGRRTRRPSKTNENSEGSVRKLGG